MIEPVAILLSVLLVVGAVLYALDRRTPREQELPTAAEPERDATCDKEDCALSGTCPTIELLAGDMAATCHPPYYDDEELDRYIGRGANDYNDEEIEQWRDVLYTLLPGDRAPWQHSIARRGITMPAAIHDELLMLLAEGSRQ